MNHNELEKELQAPQPQPEQIPEEAPEKEPAQQHNPKPRRRRANTDRNTYRPRRFSSVVTLVYFMVIFAYIEMIFHVTEFKNLSILFPVLFAIPAGLLVGTLCNMLPEKYARIARIVVSAGVMVLFCVQIVYFHSFQSFLSMSLVGMGGDVFTNFFKTILLAIWECMIPILLIFMPLAGLIFIQGRLSSKRKFRWQRSAFFGIITIITYIFAILLLPLGGKGEHSAYANFHNNWVLDLSIEKLGVLTTTGLDVKNMFAGDVIPEDVLGEDELDVPVVVTLPGEGEDDPVEETTSPTEPAYEDVYNVIPGLDFAAMAETETKAKTKKIYEYLAALEPTKKNEYTGMFEGYNLILITAESFSPMAIHPELTPTLYMLSQSGFDFTNYWATYPSNTTNGEYTNLTGLFPDISKPKSNGSFVYSIKNTMNMNIANWFNAQGVTTRAYHDHTAGYYKRNKTHPNIGYQVFKGKGQIGGLSGWPESDLIMMEKTIPEYINDEWFHTYYMTVSGHHNYRFGGYNSMADKNKKLVDDLDMGTAAKAYIATHIELDKALEHLINELRNAGKLEKTVIVLTTDHYPYGLTDSQYKGMLGHSIQYGGLERHESDLIIWNSEMETIQIDKPCSQQDVLPTLLNLFGFTYDSRLYSGMDILSDTYGLAITANQSFITDKIIYNTRYEKVYYLEEGWEMPEGYLDSYIQIVKNRFSIASNILNQNFFAKLPEDVILAAQQGKKLP